PWVGVAPTETEDAAIAVCPPRSVGGDPRIRASLGLCTLRASRCVTTCARVACEPGSVLQICLQSVVLGLRVSRGGNCTYGAAWRRTGSSPTSCLSGV